MQSTASLLSGLMNIGSSSSQSSKKRKESPGNPSRQLFQIQSSPEKKQRQESVRNATTLQLSQLLHTMDSGPLDTPRQENKDYFPWWEVTDGTHRNSKVFF